MTRFNFSSSQIWYHLRLLDPPRKLISVPATVLLTEPTTDAGTDRCHVNPPDISAS